MKNKKAVTMIILTITILVMAIILSTVITLLDTSNIIDKSKKVTTDSNLQQVREIMRSVWNNAHAKVPPTLSELQAAVDNAILSNKIDTTKYNIIVTEDEIYVSSDFIPPLITSSSMVYTNITATLNLTLGRMETEDYPVVVEYYIKKAELPDEAYSFKEKITLTSGQMTTYTYTELISGTAYNAKVLIRDANGNVASTVLNLTTR